MGRFAAILPNDDPVRLERVLNAKQRLIGCAVGLAGPRTGCVVWGKSTKQATHADLAAPPFAFRIDVGCLDEQVKAKKAAQAAEQAEDRCAGGQVPTRRSHVHRAAPPRHCTAQ